MSQKMYVVLAPVQLKPGIEEKHLLEASDAFDRDFVRKQKGIRSRMLLRGKNGGYADLVFFESKEDADRIAKIEETSEECARFFAVMEPPAANVPDMGLLSFEHVKTYD
jgi:hypothetical protein